MLPNNEFRRNSGREQEQENAVLRSGSGAHEMQGPLEQPSVPTRNQKLRYHHTELEHRWRNIWDKTETFKTNDPKPGDKTFYCLDMFPYPSGSGLHVGHPVGYIASDIVARMKRMQGYNVLHPMGWDAFGLPAEQHAIQTGQHPSITVVQNATNYKEQLKLLGLSYDWNRTVSTTDPSFMKWTQWMFIKLYEAWFDPSEKRARPIGELLIPSEVKAAGELAVRRFTDSKRLVYFDEVAVNWCPALGAILSNEEVFNGRSEKGYSVIRVPMRQMMVRITAFADRLLDGLGDLNWPGHIKEQQRNWIGKRVGVKVPFKVPDGSTINIFTDRPETILSAAFLAVAPEYPELEKIVGPEHSLEVRPYVESCKKLSDIERTTAKEPTGVFTGSYATHPITKESIPIFVAAHVLADSDFEATLGVPAHNQKDFAFASRHAIPIESAVNEAAGGTETKFSEEGPLVSSPLNKRYFPLLIGASPDLVRAEMFKILVSQHGAEPATTFHLRDWVFSRQRYWGEPIPLIHWENGTTTTLSFDELPLLLPILDNYVPKEGQSALAQAEDWLNVKDSTGQKGRRESLTMPQWAGSCWYSLRFMDPANDRSPADPTLEKTWGSVDLYVGGAEHATLHLLYSRFWFNALHDLGLIQTKEPFQRLFNQGMLTSFAYQNQQGVIFPIDEIIENPDGSFSHKDTGETVTQVTAKMSKSLKNVVNPDDIVAEYGADTFRLHLMFMGPVSALRSWNTRTLSGASRFIARAFDWGTQFLPGGTKEFIPEERESMEVRSRLNESVRHITQCIDSLHHNTGISELMKCLNDLHDRDVSRKTVETFVKILSPFAPFVSEELWLKLGHGDSISTADWPSYRADLSTTPGHLEVPMQINGKKRATIAIAPQAEEAEIHTAVADALTAFNQSLTSTSRLFIVRDKGSGVVKLINVVL